MLVIVDESIALTNWTGEHYRYEVKPLQHTFKQVLDESVEVKKRPIQLSKRNKLKYYSQIDELSFFTGLTQENSTILYIFDPHYTKELTMNRLQNWFLPDLLFRAVPLKGNHAALLYMLQKIDEWLAINGTTITYVNLIQLTDQLLSMQNHLEEYLITTRPHVFLKGRYLKRVFSNPKKKPYKLLQYKKKGLKRKAKSLEVDQLFQQLIDEQQAEGWVVGQGVDINHQLNIHYHEQTEAGFPRCISYIQVCYVSNEIKLT